eukprot:CAMPEP_0202489036 /NCGR_PEP_ID=MMETSP1361-20130828/6886_1 /ASSEMBLY_ACC=CAM_ASM_000849 /TAXON_ID=210615 /ORGANISM="Staurosira complex sp., Strain CCMP2646" /LENGTH=49 /DNA_ID=CAMNT_0049118709 /DNA_START=1 /DNA_END=150 /DNA_ORIENTATION=-
MLVNVFVNTNAALTMTAAMAGNVPRTMNAWKSVPTNVAVTMLVATAGNV